MPSLFERTLEATFGDDIRSQDAPFVFAYSLINRDLGDRAWAILQERWNEAEERFPSQLTIRLVEGVRYLTLPEQVNEAQAFFAAHPIPQSAKMLEQMLERQRVAAALRERATPHLEAHFSVGARPRRSADPDGADHAERVVPGQVTAEQRRPGRRREGDGRRPRRARGHRDLRLGGWCASEPARARAARGRRRR